MRRFLYENSLSLAMLGLFLLFLAGQSLAGWYVYNSDQQDHQQPPIPYGAYLLSGHFFEAVFENWESEFLQGTRIPLGTALGKHRNLAEKSLTLVLQLSSRCGVP